MKKTRRTIIAVVLMLATLLSFAGMPAWANETQRVGTIQALNNNARSMGATHNFYYVSPDKFALFDVLFTSYASDIISVYVNVNVWQDENLGYVSQYITDKNQEFFLKYSITVKYDNGKTATIEDVSEWITLTDARQENGYELKKDVSLLLYENITRITVQMQVRDNYSTMYVYGWSLTPAQIKAQD